MTVELNKIYCGDALKTLQLFKTESVNCIVSSPPYYALRNYNVDGQIGLEPTPKQYLKRLADVFMECRRVLTKDGTMWIVIGDSYAGSGRGIGDINKKGIQQKASFVGEFCKPYQLDGYKGKDLIGIPWSLAFALRAGGWYLRQDIIWHKPNPMPESIRDRCTKAHEYVFLFSKSAKYYFAHNAILEPAKYDGRKKMTHEGSAKYLNDAAGIATQNVSKGGRERWPNKQRGFSTKDGDTGFPAQHHGSNIPMLPARNKRSVWTVPTRGFKGAHFATFPPDLIRTCIIAGCPQGGIVLDPFMGAGTTAVVAKKLGRNFIGIELNSDYIRLAEERLGSV
ncbi:MAG: site-specific DNA-methyltransferase [Bacteroidales bacterium]|jgi:DNA modification methylase|nr:site-specific DNA-methyltransferase [Bacteroidales bacterium]